MTVNFDEKRQRYLVTVRRASALAGFERIRRFYATEAEALTAEREIGEALEVYGQWPVPDASTPLARPATPGTHRKTVARKVRSTGTLREASQLALDIHWSGMRYYVTIRNVVRALVDFMEARGCADLDDIKSEDIDALVKHHKAKDNSASTINRTLGALRIINRTALQRIPPLARVTVPTPYIKGKRIEKWWLRPDDHQKVVTALRNPVDGELFTDPLYADLIDVIAYQGLRVEEALRLEARMVIGLDTPEPWLQPPGTKTLDAQNSIPVYPQAIPPLRSAMTRAATNGWPRLFPLKPRQAADRWNDIRDYLGVRDIPTSTMKSLRRTFAWYANSRGMPTSDLQRVLRHKTISTTAGYLDLVGSRSIADTRRYFREDPTPSPPVDRHMAAIMAYKAAGATPEELARFTKELLA